MIYLIGGPARTGKSTLARQLRKKADSQAVSLDGIRIALKETVHEDWLPDLFHGVREIVYTDSPYELKYDNVRKRDRIVWDFVRSYFKDVEYAQDNITVEGTVWPDMVSDLPYDYRAVFLVDTSENLLDRLLEIKRTAEHSNWMKDIDDERIAKWAEFNVMRSKKYIELCTRHGSVYFDIREHGIDDAQKRAMDYLLHS